MVHYIFDPEEKEYVEVGRPYPYLPGPNGEPPLSPIEIYKGKREEHFRQQRKAAKEKEAKQALEQAAKEAAEKAVKEAVKEIEKQLEKDLNK